MLIKIRMATREEIQSSLDDLKANEIDSYIRRNGVGEITGPVMNAVLTEIKDNLDLLNASSYNTDTDGTDTSDIIAQGTRKQYNIVVDNIASRDLLLLGNDPVVTDGQLVTVRSGVSGRPEIYIAYNGVWNTIGAVDYDIFDLFNKSIDDTDDISTGMTNRFITVVGSIGERDTLVPNLGDVVTVLIGVAGGVEIYSWDGTDWQLLNNSVTNTDELLEGVTNKFIPLVSNLTERDALTAYNGQLVIVESGVYSGQAEIYQYNGSSWVMLSAYTLKGMFVLQDDTEIPSFPNIVKGQLISLEEDPDYRFDNALVIRGFSSTYTKLFTINDDYLTADLASPMNYYIRAISTVIDDSNKIRSNIGRNINLQSDDGSMTSYNVNLEWAADGFLPNESYYLGIDLDSRFIRPLRNVSSNPLYVPVGSIGSTKIDATTGINADDLNAMSIYNNLKVNVYVFKNLNEFPNGDVVLNDAGLVVQITNIGSTILNLATDLQSRGIRTILQIKFK